MLNRVGKLKGLLWKYRQDGLEEKAIYLHNTHTDLSKHQISNTWKMKAYVIKDRSDFPVASTLFEPQAIKFCKENEGYSYILLPFLVDEETEINIIAGPIDKEYLSNSSNETA